MADTGNVKHMSKPIKKNELKFKYTSFVAGTANSQSENKDDSPSLQEAFKAYRKARQVRDTFCFSMTAQNKVNFYVILSHIIAL